MFRNRRGPDGREFRDYVDSLSIPERMKVLSECTGDSWKAIYSPPKAEPMSNILDVEKLRKRYKYTIILFSIAAGFCLGVLSTVGFIVLALMGSV